MLATANRFRENVECQGASLLKTDKTEPQRYSTAFSRSYQHTTFFLTRTRDFQVSVATLNCAARRNRIELLG